MSIFTLLLLGVTLGADTASPASAAHTNEPSLVHFRPETGVLGDTIPFYWRGVYHVFYLKGAGWGHITSNDLVHWKQLPDALERGQERTSPDGENCWTGSIVEHKGVFHLFYTGKNSRDPKGEQKVMHAVSTDLVAWSKQPALTFYADGVIYWSKPVNGAIDDKLIYHHQAFRDPEVFRNARDGKWWLLLHAALADGSSPAVARYESDDLERWTPCQPLVVLPKSQSVDCPHLFGTNGRWYLMAADRHYTSAPSLEDSFPSDLLPYDCGELFVPKTMFDGHLRILVGWIADREGGKDSGKGLWGGVMSMPRESYADTRDRLCQRPAQKVLDAFAQTVLSLADGPPLGQRVDVPPNYVMHCQVQATRPDAEAIVALRLASDEVEAGYRVKIGFDRRTVSIGDHYRSYERICDFDQNAPVDLRVFVMDTVIECFVNDAYCFTIRAYDSPSGALKIDGAPDTLGIRNFEVRCIPQ